MKTTDWARGFFEMKTPYVKKKWSEMTEEQRIEIVNKKTDDAFPEKRKLHVEDIDSYCDEWVKKTQEEKVKLIEEYEKALSNRIIFT